MEDSELIRYVISFVVVVILSVAGERATKAYFKNKIRNLLACHKLYADKVRRSCEKKRSPTESGLAAVGGLFYWL